MILYLICVYIRCSGIRAQIYVQIFAAFVLAEVFQLWLCFSIFWINNQILIVAFSFQEALGHYPADKLMNVVLIEQWTEILNLIKHFIEILEIIKVFKQFSSSNLN